MCTLCLSPYLPPSFPYLFYFTTAAPGALHSQVIRCLLIEPNPESALNEEAGKLLLEDYEAYARHARLMTSIHAQRRCVLAGSARSPLPLPRRRASCCRVRSAGLPASRVCTLAPSPPPSCRAAGPSGDELSEGVSGEAAAGGGGGGTGEGPSSPSLKKAKSQDKVREMARVRISAARQTARFDRNVSKRHSARSEPIEFSAFLDRKAHV